MTNVLLSLRNAEYNKFIIPCLLSLAETNPNINLILVDSENSDLSYLDIIKSKYDTFKYTLLNLDTYKGGLDKIKATLSNTMDSEDFQDLEDWELVRLLIPDISKNLTLRGNLVVLDSATIINRDLSTIEFDKFSVSWIGDEISESMILINLSHFQDYVVGWYDLGDTELEFKLGGVSKTYLKSKLGDVFEIQNIDDNFISNNLSEYNLEEVRVFSFTDFSKVGKRWRHSPDLSKRDSIEFYLKYLLLTKKDKELKNYI